MGNWTTSKETTYFNVRTIADAKHFPASGEGQDKKNAATFLTIVDGTKNGEDIFVDAKVVRGADKLAGLKKGAEVTVKGTVEFALDRNGKLRGKIWDARVELSAATREALKQAGAAAAEAEALKAEAAAMDAEPVGNEIDAPAFE